MTSGLDEPWGVNTYTTEPRTINREVIATHGHCERLELNKVINVFEVYMDCYTAPYLSWSCSQEFKLFSPKNPHLNRILCHVSGACTPRFLYVNEISYICQLCKVYWWFVDYQLTLITRLQPPHYWYTYQVQMLLLTVTCQVEIWLLVRIRLQPDIKSNRTAASAADNTVINIGDKIIIVHVNILFWKYSSQTSLLNAFSACIHH